MFAILDNLTSRINVLLDTTKSSIRFIFFENAFFTRSTIPSLRNILCPCAVGKLHLFCVIATAYHGRPLHIYTTHGQQLTPQPTKNTRPPQDDHSRTTPNRILLRAINSFSNSIIESVPNSAPF